MCSQPMRNMPLECSLNLQPSFNTITTGIQSQTDCLHIKACVDSKRNARLYYIQPTNINNKNYFDNIQIYTKRP